MKKTTVALAAALLTATPALAADPAPTNGTAQNPFNCDFEPACEVAPGYYGKISAPASSKFNLAVGGFVKLDAAYNSVNFGPTGYFTPTNVPKNSSLAGRKDQTIFSIRQSRLWFKLNGPTLLGAKTNGLIEFDFSNGNTDTTSSGNLNATPRLRHAYGNIDWGTTQLLFGQTADIFGILYGNTIDFNSGSQAGFHGGTRNPQIRLTQRIELNSDNFLKFVIGLQQPYQSNFTNNNATGAAGSTGDSWGAKPNVAGQLFFISKALGVSPGYYGQSLNNFTIGVSGLYGSQEVLGQNTVLDSYGAALYTFVPLLGSVDGKSRANTLTFEGQAYLAANVNGATAAQYVGTPGKLQEARGVGFAGNFIYYPTQNLGLSTGYGRRQASPTADYRNNVNYEQYNHTYFFNASYDLNAAIRVAAEFQRFETKYGNVMNNATVGSSLAGTADKGIANVGRLALYYFF